MADSAYPFQLGRSVEAFRVRWVNQSGRRRRETVFTSHDAVRDR